MGDELATMQRPAERKPRRLPLSSIRSILLHVQNDAGLQRRVETSLAIVRATGARLHCVQVTPVEAYVTMGSLGGLGALDKWMKKIDAEEERLRRELEKHLRTEGVDWDYEQLAGYAQSELLRRAALADLVVIGREAHLARVQRPELATLGDLVTQIRTPLLLQGSKGAANLFGTAVIAWDGSYEAANSVRSGLGLLNLATDIRAIRFEDDKDSVFPDRRLLGFLSDHGIRAELDVRSVRANFARDLVDYALEIGADFIVMGGYGHSRAGEFLFGGVTRELLRDCPVSLMISH